MQISKRKEVQRLANLDKADLLIARAELEKLIRENGTLDWREQMHENGLTLGIHYDLVDAALRAIDPDPGVVVNIKPGVAVARSLGIG
jgi:hypothetical protein